MPVDIRVRRRFAVELSDLSGGLCALVHGLTPWRLPAAGSRRDADRRCEEEFQDEWLIRRVCRNRRMTFPLRTARTRQAPSTAQPTSRSWKAWRRSASARACTSARSEEHTSELHSRGQLVCRLL